MASRAEHVSVRCGGGGEMGGYLAPASSPPKGALVVVQEIFGVNAAMREIADDLASSGFTALVPDIFWRLDRNVELGNGEPGPQRDKAIDLMKRYDVELGIEDLEAAAHWLRARSGYAKVGIVGFCLGGRMTALVAANGKVDAASSFYGVGLEAYLPQLRRISVPAQFHFGAEDTQISATVIDAVRDTLTSATPHPSEVFVYPDAGHAFYNRHRADRFDSRSHKIARERMLGFFAGALQ